MSLLELERNKKYGFWYYTLTHKQPLPITGTMVYPSLNAEANFISVFWPELECTVLSLLHYEILTLYKI